jgi:hypothetical protein
MPRFTIDRFENPDWVVLENEGAQTFRVPRGWVPRDAREGDVLNATEDGSADSVRLHFKIDPSAKQERFNDATRLRDGLPRAPKGDISL